MKSYINAAKFMLNSMPAHMIFFVTARCNAKCKHCFYWKEIDNADAKKELSIDEVRKISKSMGHVKILSLTGGEPFMRNDLADIARIFYLRNNLHHLVVHTNGILKDRIVDFSKRVLKECPDMSLAVSFSIDDFEKFHDKNRGVPGIFKKVLEAVDSLQELRSRHKNFEVDVTTAVSHFNYPRMKKLMDYVREELPVDGHHIEVVRGNTREKKARAITPQQFRKIINYLRKTWTKEKRKADYPFASFRQVVDVLTPEIEMETMIKNRMILPCKAGKTVIVLGEYGDVFPCELLNKSFGNVRDYKYSMKKLLFSKNAKSLKRWIVSSKCFCTWGCAVSNNIIFNLRAYPRIIRKWLSLKIKN